MEQALLHKRSRFKCTVGTREAGMEAGSVGEDLEGKEGRVLFKNNCFLKFKPGEIL